MTEIKLTELKNYQLLLVDDDKQLLENLATTLSIFFKEVIPASHGKEAIEIYNNHHVDMIITDYVMPIMSGHKFCSEIRKKDQKVPILMMSNSTDQEKLLNMIPLNLTGFLIKPIDYSTLCSSLMKLLDRVDKGKSSIKRLSKDLSYNRATKKLLLLDKEIRLTKSEVKLLDILLENRGIFISSENLGEAIDERNIKSEQAVKNIIHRLRSKIGKNLITNVQGLGYVMESL